MTARLKLVVFDIDGTLVDSQAEILAAMARGFEAAGLPVPSREAVLGIVGLSLAEAVERLVPDAPEATRRTIVAAYRDSFANLRAQAGGRFSPLFPRARDTLERLARRDDVLLGVATGKSRRGLEALKEAHGLQGLFVTEQVADDHPSKPHPSMLFSALAETGVAPDMAVMVGDTSYDMQMARAASVAGIGVAWGYHPASELHLAERVVRHFDELDGVLETIWGRAA